MVSADQIEGLWGWVSALPSAGFSPSLGIFQPSAWGITSSTCHLAGSECSGLSSLFFLGFQYSGVPRFFVSVFPSGNFLSPCLSLCCQLEDASSLGMQYRSSPVGHQSLSVVLRVSSLRGWWNRGFGIWRLTQSCSVLYTAYVRIHVFPALLNGLSVTERVTDRGSGWFPVSTSHSYLHSVQNFLFSLCASRTFTLSKR